MCRPGRACIVFDEGFPPVPILNMELPAGAAAAPPKAAGAAAVAPKVGAG